MRESIADFAELRDQLADATAHRRILGQLTFDMTNLQVVYIGDLFAKPRQKRDL